MTRSRRYPLLFSPANLGPVRVENRIVLTAHLTNFAQDGLPTDQHAAYYEARADGGAGLVITEERSSVASAPR
jgi:2,4-dienoyl-CoA reductase (NADPH2)